MDLINGYLVQLGNWIRPHIMLVAMAQVATLLTIYGEHINVVVRVLVKPYHFIVRLAAFVALCTFGYGAFTAFVTPVYAGMIHKVPANWLGLSVIGSFILIGFLAEWQAGSRR